MVGEHGRFLVGEIGLLYRVFTETDIRIVLPKTLRCAVLKLVHGSRMVGHWGGGFENGGKIAEAVLVGRMVCCG
jgi:hypothetical protein